MTARLILIAATLTAAAACSRGDDASTTKEAWNQANAPQIFGVQSALWNSVPTAGSVAKTPWSSDYWATFRGGLSYRWQLGSTNSTDYRSYQYAPMSAQQAQSLSSSQLNQLSPSEKYDLFTGRTDFPLTRSEQQAVLAAASQGGGQVATWNGICHGWAAAATTEAQPGSNARVTLRDGRTLDFTNGDLQALLSRTYSDFNYFQYSFIGGRCETDHPQLDQFGRPVDPACRDVNPGTFHLVLGEMIGRQQRPFIADIQNDEQVWNQPIYGYRSQVGSPIPYNGQDGRAGIHAFGTAALVDVSTDLLYTDEQNPSVSMRSPSTDSLRVSYQLELDRNGYIIGGEWTSKDRPDFMWQVRSQPNTRGAAIDYATVKQLIAQSNGSSPQPQPQPQPEPQPQPQPGGNLQLNVADFRVIPDGTGRPLAVASGTAFGGGAAYVQLDAVGLLGVVTTLDREPVLQGGQFRVQGRILELRAREYRLLILDSNLRAIGQRSLGGG